MKESGKNKFLGEETMKLFNVPSVGENIAVVVLQSVGARSDHFDHHIGSFPRQRELVFLLGRLGPSKHEVSDLEDTSSDFPLMVPVESLLVTSGADDGRLVGLLEQVDYILLSLHGSVMVEGLHSWGAMVEVEGQHYFSSVSQEEGCEPYGLVRGYS